ncbi:Diatom spindle kinesin 1 [Apostasia shenzhenica]|uniref:Kinesin-like protein n=1 Tax=Apostasia shenzhenica TaxID=1088818 RepID=A0A2I0B6R4_9ASPA|nr:Diatom spindle kinesin 1 [Apostasia shenzhenica]
MSAAAAAAGGRQMQRSGHQHQRQYSSEQFLLDSFSSGSGAAGKRMQGLPSSGFSSQQVEYSRILRSAQRGMSGELMLPSDPSMPPLSTRPSSQRKTRGDLSPSDLSPGILDLHSIDSELLSDIPFSGLYDGSAPFGHAKGRSFGDSEPSYFTDNKLGNARIMPENNISTGKSFAADKEKPSSVAKIKVVVRKRPLNKKEIAKKEEDIITIERHANSLTAHESKLKVDLTEYVEKHEFVFDAVLDEDVSNDEVYRETVEPIIPTIFERTKATCFAYGQTGNAHQKAELCTHLLGNIPSLRNGTSIMLCSGKTYTMQPLPLRASQDILRLMHHVYWNQGFKLFVSFFEIYGGKVFDLLNDRRKLCMREDGKQQVCIVGLQEFRVSNVETIREIIEKGNATRSTGTTGANEESSRSHAILQLAIKRSADVSESKPPRVVGKLSFIDLAGSERGADTTDNDKQTRIEGAEINKSLLALKECIRALDNDQVHIPFRGSKLTEVLRDSFIGNSRTVMISCISPSSGSCEHTLNTLRYADRVKSLSKGSNLKKDSSARESPTLPLSSVFPNFSAPESSNNELLAHEIHRFGWSKQIENSASSHFSTDHVPSVREDARLASSYSNRSNQTRGSTTPEEYDLSDGTYDPDNQPWKKAGPYSSRVFEDMPQRVAAKVQTRIADDTEIEADNLSSDDDFNDLIKEMMLLDEADQPGNQLDNYLARLNAILSQKAAGIVNLQSSSSPLHCSFCPASAGFYWVNLFFGN